MGVARVGIAVALVAATFLIIHFGTNTLDGLAAEIAAGIASLIAVVIVTTMVLWMRKAARTISGNLKSGMEKALVVGPVAVLSLSFFAVGREGLETALLMVATPRTPPVARGRSSGSCSESPPPPASPC